MNTDNITISGETIDYGLVHLWTITTKEPYLALLTHKVVMHMEINHIWPHGSRTTSRIFNTDSARR